MNLPVKILIVLNCFLMFICLFLVYQSRSDAEIEHDHSEFIADLKGSINSQIDTALDERLSQLADSTDTPFSINSDGHLVSKLEVEEPLVTQVLPSETAPQSRPEDPTIIAARRAAADEYKALMQNLGNDAKPQTVIQDDPNTEAQQ